MYSRQALADGFRRLGLGAGDTVMVHASIRSVGEVAGGPDQIHLALKDVLTDAGTLMMYASCPAYVDEIGRGNLTADEERELLEKLPAFDPLTARSARDNGALVELLRTYPGSSVNHHVARFVVWGKHAAHLISTQPWNYAFGRQSALERFVELDGKILMLGCDHDTVTFLHYAEHIADIPGKRVARYKVPVDDSGVRRWRDMEEIDTSGGRRPSALAGPLLRAAGGCLSGQDRQRWRASRRRGCFLLDARGLLAFVLPVMQASPLTHERPSG